MQVMGDSNYELVSVAVRQTDITISKILLDNNVEDIILTKSEIRKKSQMGKTTFRA